MLGLCLAMRWPMCCCAMPSELPLAAFVVVYYNKEKKRKIPFGDEKGEVIMPLCRRLAPVFALVMLLCLASFNAVFATGADVSSQSESSVSETSSVASSAVSSAVSSGEREFINTEPISSLPSEVGGREYPVGTLAWIVIFVCVLVIVLFVCGARLRGRAVHPRSAARSRWKKTNSSHASLNERYYHDRTHFRK